jgi:outer membrane immunogenic protein
MIAPAIAEDVAPYQNLPPPPGLAWTGFYIGANGGWIGSINNNVTNSGTDAGIHGLGSLLLHGRIPSSISLSQNGFVGGAQVGFNWQVAPIWVLGMEADFDLAGAKGKATVAFPGVPGHVVPFSTVYNRELDTLGTFRTRAGFLSSPSLLWFATGGIAFGQSSLGSAFLCDLCGPPTATQAATAGQSGKTAVGWTLGTGVEWSFAPSWSVKAEYLYVNFGSQNNTIWYTYGPHGALINASSLTSTATDSDNVARVGLNYQFDSF